MRRNNLKKAIYLLTAGLIVSFGSSTPGLADGGSDSDLRQGLPGRRISGGVRIEPSADSCFTNFDQSLVSVMPRTNLGLTAMSHPTLWFSLPETTGSKSGEFQLLTELDELVYSTPIEMGDASGVSEFQLPPAAPALAMDKNYKWRLSLACNHGSQSPVLGLEGWIRRVNISTALADQIAAASSEERVFLYGTAGLWQEQITELMNLRRQNSGGDDLQQAWTALIASTGLMSEVSNDIVESMIPIEATASSTLPLYDGYR